MREELERFFLNVVFFEDKAPSLLGWGDAGEAWQLVRGSSAGGRKK